MSLQKPLIALATITRAGLTTYLGLISPESTLLLLCLAAYTILSYRKPFWGLCLLLILPVFGEFSRIEIFGRSMVLSDIIIPLFELAALAGLKNFVISGITSRVLKTLLFFLIIAFFSLLFSLTALPLNEVLQSSLYLIRLILYIALFPLTFLVLSPDQSRQLIIYIAISALLVALTGFAQLTFLPSLEALAKSSGYDPHINRLVGSWLDPNFIGGFFAMISLLLLSISLYEKSIRLKIFYWLSSTILLIALFLTYSRSAYLALAVGILTLGLLRARKLLLIFLIIGAIGISVSDRAQQRVGELVTSINSVLFNSSENPDPTARLRIQNWEQTWQLIGQNPWLGHGYNTLTYIKLNQGFIQDESTHSASGSDSSLLTILVTTGVFGLLPFLYFLWLILKNSFLAWHKPTSTTNQLPLEGLGLGMFCTIIALFVHSNFVNSLFFPQIMIYFWILLGLFYFVAQHKQAITHGHQRPEKP